MNMRGALSLSILSLMVACTAASCVNGAKQKMSESLPTCTTLVQCVAHNGQRVHVVGIYTIYNVMPKRKLDDDEISPVRIALDDEMGPFLAAYWHADAARSAEEKARYKGRRVRVTGTFNEAMPPYPDSRMAQLAGPCIHPVEKIELAD